MSEPGADRLREDVRQLLTQCPFGIGFHVSIAGGFGRAVGRALERECTALQIFCGNPRAWALRRPDEGEIQAFCTARTRAGLHPLFVHSCYLVNPCSQDPNVLRRSIKRLGGELELSHCLGADAYVLHPGSHKGRPADWGILRASESIGSALHAAGETVPALLLEGMASSHGPGGEMRRLGALIDRLKDGAPNHTFGIALDTCHLFGAGYDLRDHAEVERLVNDVDGNVGLPSLHLIHVNDSRDGPGSRRDRHTHIGEGTIGEVGLTKALNHPALNGKPLILETPWESAATDLQNLLAVLRLIQ